MTEQAAISWTSSSRSDVGMVRDVNEDACLERPDLGLWVVADGMGGHTAGDVASKLICKMLETIDPPDSLSAYIAEVEQRLLDVNERLRGIGKEKESQTIGSTVVALVARDRHAVCVWAGDSRLYRCRAGQIVQVTQDHALVEELVEKGVLTRAQAESHPQGNLVTRAIGAADQVKLDFEIVELKPGDVFILCTDGLDKELHPEEMLATAERDNERSLSDALVDLALSRGSRDNVTVVTVHISGGGEEESAGTEPGSGVGSEATLPRIKTVGQPGW